jgi:hypothetical protein
MPVNPLASPDVPANLVPTAGMMNQETVKERRRQEKMQELRQYLVDAGVVEAVVKLFVGIQEQDYRPPEAPNLLKDFFGDYRDPLWDEIEQARGKIAKDKKDIDELKAHIAGLEGEVAAAERGKSGKELLHALLNKVPGETQLTAAIFKTALVGPKAKGFDPELPEEVDIELIAKFFAALAPQDPHLEFGVNLTHELIHGEGYPYATNPTSEDLLAFLGALNSFCAAAADEE